MSNIDFGERILSGLLVTAKTVQNGCLYAAGVVFMIMVIKTLLTAAGNGKIDWSDYARAIAIIFIIGSYSQIMVILNDIVQALIDIVPEKKDIGKAFIEAVKSIQVPEAFDKALDNKYADTKWWQIGKHFSYKRDKFILESAPEIINMRGIWRSFAIDWSISGFRILYELARNIILMIMYMVGPFALLTSILWHEVADKWLKGYLYVSFWMITIRLIDHACYNVQISYVVNPFEAVMDNNYYKGLMKAHFGDGHNFLFIIIYLLVPTITSWWFVKSSTENAMSKLVGTTAMVGLATMKVATTVAKTFTGVGAASAAASAAGSVASAASRTASGSDNDYSRSNIGFKKS